MALKAILDTLDGLPDPVKAEYVERNGKFELQVEGMKSETDFNRVQTALTQEKKGHGELINRVKLLGDHKIEDVVAQLDRIPELEAAAAGKLDDEKINGIVEGRVRAKLAPVERERDTYKSQLADKDKLIEDYTAKERRAAIHDAVRKAATSAKVVPEALEDALLLAERVFELDEKGKVITKDNVGVTPGLEPSVWLTDLQKSRPHWWGPSMGGGGLGNRGGGGSNDNPWSHENWNMTKQGEVYRADKNKAEQLARAAGTTIGGAKPKPKK